MNPNADAVARSAALRASEWRHAKACEFERGRPDCTCGLDDALMTIRAALTTTVPEPDARLLAWDRSDLLVIREALNEAVARTPRGHITSRALDRAVAKVVALVYADSREPADKIAADLRNEAVKPWRTRMEFAEAHSLPDHNDGNVRVERGAWESLLALLADSTPTEGKP